MGRQRGFTVSSFVSCGVRILFLQPVNMFTPPPLVKPMAFKADEPPPHGEYTLIHVDGSVETPLLLYSKEEDEER